MGILNILYKKGNKRIKLLVAILRLDLFIRRNVLRTIEYANENEI